MQEREPIQNRLETRRRKYSAAVPQCVQGLLLGEQDRIHLRFMGAFERRCGFRALHVRKADVIDKK